MAPRTKRQKHLTDVRVLAVAANKVRRRLVMTAGAEINSVEAADLQAAPFPEPEDLSLAMEESIAPEPTRETSASERCFCPLLDGDWVNRIYGKLKPKALGRAMLSCKTLMTTLSISSVWHTSKPCTGGDRKMAWHAAIENAVSAHPVFEPPISADVFAWQVGVKDSGLTAYRQYRLLLKQDKIAKRAAKNETSLQSQNFAQWAMAELQGRRVYVRYENQHSADYPSQVYQGRVVNVGPYMPPS